MIFYYVDGDDQSTNISEGTLVANNQLQQRSDQAQFEMRNVQPLADQTVHIYIGDQVASTSTATVVLAGYFQRETNIFYPGQELRLRPQTATEEKAVVVSFDEDTLTLVLEEAPNLALVAGDQIAQMVFAGFIARVQDKNISTLENLLWDVTAVDFSKLFDAKIVTNSWENKGARYIINDFCNQFVNYNVTLDNMSYDSTPELQAVWAVVNGDGVLPVRTTSDYIEGSAGASFTWTHSGGTASWEATITPTDISDLVGASHGQPNAGSMMIWPEFDDVSVVTSLKIRIGSDSSNYLEIDFDLPTVSGDFVYNSEVLSTLTPVGDPNWRSVEYIEVFINETASSSVVLNGLRINSNSAFTLRQVKDTQPITDYRSSQVKAAELINRLAKAFEFAWYVDYDLDLFFSPIETLPAPFQITDETYNFNDLKISTDVSNLGNRIIVNGGQAPTQSFYAQAFKTDGVLREWVLQAAPSGFSLTVLVDNGTSTASAVAGTSSTAIVFAAPHGLSVGDHLVNTSRGSVVREVLTVPTSTSVSVLAVPGQTSGDVISFFSVSQTAGIEGLADESTVDYVYSSERQSVRASLQTVTIPTGQFIRFRYKELAPIIVQYADGVSVSALKALGLGNGVFDLAPISDPTITDAATALLTAQAQVSQFSNAVINGTFTTIQKGLRAGQILTINQEIERHFTNDYLIQKVSYKQRGGKYQDYVEYTVTFGTTLFGFIELMQKALRKQNSFGSDTANTSITLIVSGDEDAIASDTNTAVIGGTNPVSGNETPTAADTNNVTTQTGAWQWEQSTGQAVPTRWNLFEWS